MTAPLLREVSKLLNDEGVTRRTTENPHGFSVGRTPYGVRVTFPRNAPKADTGNAQCADILIKAGYAVQRGTHPLEVRVFPRKGVEPAPVKRPSLVSPHCPMCRSGRAPNVRKPSKSGKSLRYTCQNCKCRFSILKT